MFSSLTPIGKDLKASQSNRELLLESNNNDAHRRNWGLEHDDSSTRLLNRMNTVVDKMTAQPTPTNQKKGYSKFVSKKLYM